jgi:hypothetical protein
VHQLDEQLFQPDFQPQRELHQALPVTAHDYWCEMIASWVL